MKKLFYLSFLLLLLFEIANVYFIMPMPGSQRMDSLGFAYFLYSWRWVFRGLLLLGLVTGLVRSNWKRKWTLAIPLLILAAVAYMVNFIMAADAMFKQPRQIILVNTAENKVDADRLIIGVVDNGIAKAYPIQFLGYHHFVYDTLNGKNILVTYCTVCRTGRVYDPVYNEKLQHFRLVGMDHFNAMIEDADSKSWWQQATGLAVTGKLKGSRLNEIHSTQTSLAKWMELYPNTLIMQADPSSLKKYSTTYDYESGKSKSNLTGTDPLSWKEKSWVIGVRANGDTKVFDWNELKQKKILTGDVGKLHAFVVLAKDDKSFFAYENYSNGSPSIMNDTILLDNKKYRINGSGIDTSYSLQPLNAYQEFWHSWRYFGERGR